MGELVGGEGELDGAAVGDVVGEVDVEVVGKIISNVVGAPVREVVGEAKRGCCWSCTCWRLRRSIYRGHCW